MTQIETESAGRTDGNVPRILHVINGEHYSGAERVQDLLAQRLPDFGFEVVFACVKPGKFPGTRQSLGSPCVNVPMRNRVDVRAARQLVRLAREHHCRLLHAHTPRSLMLARIAATLGQLPLVYHVHSPTSRDSTRPFRNWINSATERFNLRGVDRMIAVSQSLGRYLEDAGYDSERWTVVPNGVPALFPSLPQRATPGDEWVLSTVALFRPRKGTEVLLQAVAKLRRAGRQVRLRAIGGFETSVYECLLRDQVRDLGIEDAVEWTGFTTDVATELQNSDIFVLPSLFGEGLPMVVLEAMACGLPIVGTRIEGVPEAVRHNVDGLLAEPGNTSQLAQAIDEIIQGESRWQQLREQAWLRQQEVFSDHAMAAGVAAVYRDILKTAPVDDVPARVLS